MSDRIPTRERRPSVGVPVVDIQGAVGPAGMTRPKHKRTFTGFGPQEIQTVEGTFSPPATERNCSPSSPARVGAAGKLAGFPVAAHPPLVIRRSVPPTVYCRFRFSAFAAPTVAAAPPNPRHWGQTALTR